MEIKISSDAEKVLKKFNNTKEVEKDISKLIKNTLYGIEKDSKKNLDKNGSVDTGRLKGSITTNIISSYCGEVGTNVEYAECVEYGTRPHKIGNWQHPGSQAKPYFKPAVDKNEEKFNKGLDEILDRLIE